MEAVLAGAISEGSSLAQVGALVYFFFKVKELEKDLEDIKGTLDKITVLEVSKNGG